MGSSWDEINAKLAKWRDDPDFLADEDIIVPSEKAMEAAIASARRLQAEGGEVPERVVPDGDGGIVFSWWIPSRLERSIWWNTLEFSEDGSIEEHHGRDEKRKVGG